jgi:hypothetical protein
MVTMVPLVAPRIWPPGAPVVSTSTTVEPGIWGAAEAEAVGEPEGVGEPDRELEGVGKPEGELEGVREPDGELVLVPLPEVVPVNVGVGVPDAGAPAEGVPEGVAELLGVGEASTTPCT